MWLPRDERRLVANLTHLLASPGTKKGYNDLEYVEMLKWPRGWRHVNAYGESGAKEEDGPGMEDMEAFKKEIKRLCLGEQRSQRALQSLSKRDLIVLTPHQGDRTVQIVELTVEGYDLGRRYASLLGWMGLWIREYKWLWGLVTLVLGALLAHFVHRILGK